MINVLIMHEVEALEPAPNSCERWQQYSDTLQSLVLQVSTEDRDELAQMIAERLGL